MADLTQSRFTPRLVMGVVVIIIGVLLTLRNLGVPGMQEPLEYWPLILVVIGLGKVLGPRDAPGRGFGLFLMVLGGLLLLDTLSIIPARIWDLWPLLLIFAGGYLIWRVGVDRGGAALPGDPGSAVRAFALLGSVVRRSTSRDFRGGEVTAILGGCAIDLKDAGIGSAEAVLDVFAWWGGIEVRVPADWTVVSRVVPVLGSVEDKTRSSGTDPKHCLIVTGTSVMGSVEIMN